MKSAPGGVVQSLHTAGTFKRKVSSSQGSPHRQLRPAAPLARPRRPPSRPRSSHTGAGELPPPCWPGRPPTHGAARRRGRVPGPVPVRGRRLRRRPRAAGAPGADVCGRHGARGAGRRRRAGRGGPAGRGALPRTARRAAALRRRLHAVRGRAPALRPPAGAVAGARSERGRELVGMAHSRPPGAGMEVDVAQLIHPTPARRRGAGGEVHVRGCFISRTRGGAAQAGRWTCAAATPRWLSLTCSTWTSPASRRAPARLTTCAAARRAADPSQPPRRCAQRRYSGRGAAPTQRASTGRRRRAQSAPHAEKTAFLCVRGTGGSRGLGGSPPRAAAACSALGQAPARRPHGC